MAPFPTEFIIPFAYNKQEHIKCCWQRMIEWPIPYEEKHWLEYETDYSVTKPEDQDTGGMLTVLVTIPPEAEQLVIRRVTPNTQEVDLHNGSRLTAELLESMSDKITMALQENTEQKVEKDDINAVKIALFEELKDFDESKQDRLPDRTHPLIDNAGKVNDLYLPDKIQRFFVTQKWFNEASRPLKPGRYIITDGM